MSPNIFCYGGGEWKFQINGKSSRIESAFLNYKVNWTV